MAQMLQTKVTHYSFNKNVIDKKSSSFNLQLLFFISFLDSGKKWDDSWEPDSQQFKLNQFYLFMYIILFV